MEGKKNIVHPYKVRGLDHGAYESPVPFVFLVAGQKLAFPSAEGEKFNKAQLQLHLLMVMDILWLPWPLRYWVSPLIWAPLLALFPFLSSCFFPGTPRQAHLAAELSECEFPSYYLMFAL